MIRGAGGDSGGFIFCDDLRDGVRPILAGSVFAGDVGV